MLESKLYDFLVNPKYKVWRHILLISVFVLIAVTQMRFAYQDSRDILGNYMFVIYLLTSAIYMLAIYVNIYFLVPRFLLNRQYRSYFAGLLSLTFIVITYLVIQEYVVRSILYLDRKYYCNLITIVANLPLFVTSFICFMSTSVSMLFKKRTEENQRVSQMEQEHIKSELDCLKEQISPSFLSNILNRVSKLIETDPNKASDMLMRLGKLLRYQLYDCNRDKVLLSGEVRFIKEYLDVEQMYSDRFGYEFTIDDSIKELFIPPMLLIPFVQNTLSKIDESQEQKSLYLNLKLIDNNLIFTCKSTNKELLLKTEPFAIEKRLNLIYPDSYSLSTSEGITRLQLNNVLEL